MQEERQAALRAPDYSARFAGAAPGAYPILPAISPDFPDISVEEDTDLMEEVMERIEAEEPAAAEMPRCPGADAPWTQLDLCVKGMSIDSAEAIDACDIRGRNAVPPRYDGRTEFYEGLGRA